VSAVRKVLLIAALVGAGFIVAGRDDIVRFLKIKQISLGQGRPRTVPAGGPHRYPAPGRGTPDGTSDFDSASRGGPAGGW
jgi:hypothetical protein